MKDYSELFTYVIAPHLHKLVELVGDTCSEKVLVHEWVLAIEHNWTVYAIKPEYSESEFIARLSFWIGGLRERFEANTSKNEVVEILNETFDASTFCYFEYGARREIEHQIEEYCNNVDIWIRQKVLTPRLKKFKSSQKLVPLINSEIETLQEYGMDISNSKIEMSKNINTASELEMEFSTIFETITEKYIELMRLDMNRLSEIKNHLESFENTCKNLGYKEIPTKKQKKEIEEIDQLIKEKQTIKKVIENLFKNLRKYDPELPEPQNYPPLTNLFDNTLNKINTQKIFTDTYHLCIDVLKRHPENGEKIIEETDKFIETYPQEHIPKNKKKEFNNLKNNAILKIRIVNIFGKSKENIEVILKSKSIKIDSKKTNKDGEVDFSNIPKESISIEFIRGSKEKTYQINTSSYYNKKKIRILSL